MGRTSGAEAWLTQSGLEYIHGYMRQRKTLEAVAEAIGVDERTLRRWRKKYPEIDEALQRGMEPVDFRVESAMYTSACGQIVKLKKPIKIREVVKTKGKGEKVTERIEYATEEIYVPPDSRAQMNWLRNRDPVHWNMEQRAEVVLNGTEGEAVMAEIEARMEAEAL